MRVCVVCVCVCVCVVCVLMCVWGGGGKATAYTFCIHIYRSIVVWEISVFNNFCKFKFLKTICCLSILRPQQQTHTEITRWAQGRHNLVIGLSVPYKVVTTLSQPCIRIVSTLQGCGS